ncbi:MAG: glycine--tRNA ligase subunit beta [Candidatus Eisenbacteria bacterium]|nr:glycine--tRNA ligase subunit beta [Candidatus Eisenbacteria bacterium]
MKQSTLDFLLEIGVEELPASYIEPAVQELRHKTASELDSRRLKCSSIDVYSTPRRLTIHVKGLAERQEDLEKEVVGPASRVAYDDKGAPTQAAKGFARSQGVGVECLAIKKTGRGDYVCAIVKEHGKPTKEVLSEFLPSLVLSLSFPKTMTWAEPSVRFGRPVRWIVALLGDEVVPLEVAGVNSDRLTFGNRFLAPEPIKLKNASEYLGKLEKAWVIADAEERRRAVDKIVREEARKKGGAVVEDPELVGIVANLVEFPVPVAGSFDKNFLALPRDVVVTAMREHQRYFAVQDDHGNLMPFFITLRNGGKEGEDNVRVGNERVLRARLDDARFYWEKDVSIGIARQLELLKDVVWQESLGSVFDKSERLAELSQFVMESWDKSRAASAKRAGLLCKVDLVSEMVRDGKEFTTLQGIMGGEYAARAGEDASVSQAIKEHYLPGFAGDTLPSSLEGCAVSIADRLDEIVGSFATDRIPSGSEDPYGVRRQANGIMRILIEKKLHFSLSSCVEKAIQLLSRKFGGEGGSGWETGLSGGIASFLAQRLAFILSEMGIEQDVVDAVLSVDSDDPFRSWLKAEAVARWKSNEQFSGVVISFKRVSNILKTHEYPTPVLQDLREEVERNLFQGLREASGLISSAVKSENYGDAIGHLLNLKAPIDAFFDGVLVMDQDAKVRDIRLGLLAFVRSEFLKLADFSRLSEQAEQGRGR